MRGGRSWFAVDSKSFEISVEFREKLKGIIVERSRGFTSWIRFGSLSLCCLLEGVEAYCRGELAKRFVKSWEDGDRKFKLERCANEADKFLLCFVVDSEAKKYCLVFSEGKGILGGWALLAEKLRSLGVLTRDEPKGVFDFFRTESRVGALEGKAKNSYADVMKSREEKIRGSSVATAVGKRCAKRKGFVGQVSSWEMGKVSHAGSKLVHFGQLGKISLEP